MSKSSSTSSGPSQKEKRGNTPKADREGVSAVFAQFGQFLNASRRPLPNQHGDGSYTMDVQRTGLKKDLKYLRMKGAIPQPIVIDDVY